MGSSFFISEANHFVCPWVLHLLCSEANHFLCPCMGASFFISEAEISISHVGFFENRIGQQHLFIKNNLFISQYFPRQRDKAPPPRAFHKSPDHISKSAPNEKNTQLRSNVVAKLMLQKKYSHLFDKKIRPRFCPQNLKTAFIILHPFAFL